MKCTIFLCIGLITIQLHASEPTNSTSSGATSDTVAGPVPSVIVHHTTHNSTQFQTTAHMSCNQTFNFGNGSKKGKVTVTTRRSTSEPQDQTGQPRTDTDAQNNTAGTNNGTHNNINSNTIGQYINQKIDAENGPLNLQDDYAQDFYHDLNSKPTPSKPTLHPSYGLAAACFILGKSALGGMCIGYGMINAAMLYTSYITLIDKQAWSAWKEETSLELLSKAESTHAIELYKAIKATYAHAPASTNFLSPLMHFTHDTDKELKQLRNFIKLHEWIDYYNVSLLFPAQTDALAKAHHKIKRLEYLKALMLKSVGEYKA